MNYKNKVVIVTGGEAGIGRAIADRLNSLTAAVISMDIHAKDEKDKQGIRHMPCDISSREQVEATVQRIANEYGKIDVLINNAGAARPQLLVDVDKQAPEYEINEASFQFLFDINVKGVVFCTQAVVKHFLDKKIKGVVVNMSA